MHALLEGWALHWVRGTHGDAQGGINGHLTLQKKVAPNCEVVIITKHKCILAPVQFKKICSKSLCGDKLPIFHMTQTLTVFVDDSPYSTLQLTRALLFID